MHHEVDLVVLVVIVATVGAFAIGLLMLHHWLYGDDYK